MSSRENGLSNARLTFKSLQDGAYLLSHQRVFIDLGLEVFKDPWIYHTWGTRICHVALK
jgi:hypothetical protein